jgi:hypothetical protein
MAIASASSAAPLIAKGLQNAAFSEPGSLGFNAHDNLERIRKDNTSS